MKLIINGIKFRDNAEYNACTGDRPGMELILQKGRATTKKYQSEKELHTYDLLDFLHITYERVDHEAAETMKSRSFC